MIEKLPPCKVFIHAPAGSQLLFIFNVTIFTAINNKTWVMTCDNETTEPQGKKKTRLPPRHFISVKPKKVLPRNTFNS